MFWRFIAERYGLRFLLALIGFASESLKKLITVIRATNDKSFPSLTNRAKWAKTVSENDIKEWSNSAIENLIKNNAYFRKGIINLFFEAPTMPFFVSDAVAL